jgi:DNA replication licensing factor MCM2
MSQNDRDDDIIEDDEEIQLDEEELRAEREGEDLYASDWEKDYDVEEDHYDSQQIDDNEYKEMTYEQRVNAENILNREQRGPRGTFFDTIRRITTEHDENSVQESSVDRPLPQNILIDERSVDSHISESEDDDDLGSEEINFKELHGKIKEWILSDKPRKLISRKFKKFLAEFQIQEKRLYQDRISKMASENKASLEVSYKHLSVQNHDICILLADEPTEVLKILNTVANHHVASRFPEYKNIHKEIFVRITDLPQSEGIRDLRQEHLNQLIKVTGVVTRRTTVLPQLSVVKFECGTCGALIGPVSVNERANNVVKPNNCPTCEAKGPFHINQSQTIYRNYQKLVVQESPGSVPPGRIPRSKEVILLNDLIDCVRPGDEVDVTGVYKHSFDLALNSRQGFPVFSTVIDANHVEKTSDKIILTLSPQDKKSIIEMGKDPNIQKKIVASLAPSIYGHENIKLALALALFGGQSKNIGGKHRIRGDLNILLVGDPGTAKSQFLKYVEKTASRAIYTTGKGSTAVGLTASVHKDPLSKEWVLEGGALVLADNGVCMIDEFDKMNDQDRTSIHEAMEQQSISISKAGIVTTLQARCSVIAAANPIKGTYDNSRTFQQNVNLSDPILSRFDVLCVVKDVVDPIQDELLATFVVDSHDRHHPDNMKSDKDVDTSQQEPQQKKDSIDQDLLRKYIIYAKQNYHPKLQKIDSQKLVGFYRDLRQASFKGGGIPISVRHLESLFRLAEANARMHLRDLVRDDDLDTAISVMLESFISTQKYSVSNQLKRSFNKYLVTDKDNNQILAHLLQNCVRDASTISQEEDRVEVDFDEFEARAKAYDIFKLDGFLKSDVFTSNYEYHKKEGKIIKTF